MEEKLIEYDRTNIEINSPVFLIEEIDAGLFDETKLNTRLGIADSMSNVYSMLDEYYGKERTELRNEETEDSIVLVFTTPYNKDEYDNNELIYVKITKLFLNKLNQNG